MATILLVDDDPLQAFLRKSILEAQFPDVQRATDAAEALCLVEQPQFAANLALVISGHHMPGLGGPAFVAEIRTRLPWIPILVLGGVDEYPEDYAGSGACFRPRPVSSEDLLALTRQLLTQNVRKTA
jgi:CheY-like chemotaxis protein